MIFLGILWVTSWVGSFMSLNQSLPPNFLVKVNPAKASTNLGKIVSQPRPLLGSFKQPTNHWNAALMPRHLLKMDWKTQKPKPPAPQKLSNPSRKTKNSKSQFCRSTPKVLSKQPVAKTSIFLNSSALIETRSINQDFFPNKVLRSLQNFFRLSNSVEPSFVSTSLPVVIVHRAENNYEVWVKNRLVASLLNKQQASIMQQRLTRLLKSSNLNALQLRPALVDGVPALMAGNRFLFGIEEQIASQINRSGDLLAIEWINNLRQALRAPKLSLVEGQLEMYGLTSSREKMHGLASWYGPYFHGRLTANGEIFNENELTVAHKTLPFNTYLQVTNQKTGRAVIVRVNDRGPYIPHRTLDLSRLAAQCIDSEIAGVVPYEAVILHPSQPKMTLQGTKLTLQNQKSPRKMAVISEF